MILIHACLVVHVLSYWETIAVSALATLPARTAPSCVPHRHVSYALPILVVMVAYAPILMALCLAPVPPGHTGDRCELTSVHFSSPSYARLADLLEPTNRHTITLSVSTITPTGLLLYTGEGNHTVTDTVYKHCSMTDNITYSFTFTEQ